GGCERPGYRRRRLFQIPGRAGGRRRAAGKPARLSPGLARPRRSIERAADRRRDEFRGDTDGGQSASCRDDRVRRARSSADLATRRHAAAAGPGNAAVPGLAWRGRGALDGPPARSAGQPARDRTGAKPAKRLVRVRPRTTRSDAGRGHRSRGGRGAGRADYNRRFVTIPSRSVCAGIRYAASWRDKRVSLAERDQTRETKMRAGTVLVVALALGATTALLPPPASAQSLSKDKIRVAIGVDAAYSPIYYAKQAKLFEAAGLNIEAMQFTHDDDAIDTIHAPH